MKINTERFGELEVEEKDLLHLKNGLIGFPDCTRVLLLNHTPESPFRWLQSADEPGLAFVVIDPLLLIPDYPMEVLGDALADEDSRPANLAVAAITSVPPAPAPITVNLAAPVAFDVGARVGAQVVLQDERFTTRHTLAQDEKQDEPEATSESG